MKKNMLYIVVAVILISIICLIAYMRYAANKSPSILGGGYDKEMQSKIEEAKREAE